MLNPYVLLGGILAVIALTIGAYAKGHSDGVDKQALVTAKQAADFNTAIAEQKKEATGLLISEQQKVIAKQTENDNLRAKLESNHAKDAAETERVRTVLSTERLRFATAEGPGRGQGCSSPLPPRSPAAANDSPASVELSATVTNALLQMTYEADVLADNYRVCYAFTHPLASPLAP